MGVLAVDMVDIASECQEAQTQNEEKSTEQYQQHTHSPYGLALYQLT